MKYMDGACFDNGKDNARCGSGVWLAPGDTRNAAIRVPGELQSNQPEVGEIAAIIKAVNAVPTFWPLLIKSDSKYVINRLTKHLSEWENSDKKCTTFQNGGIPPEKAHRDNPV